MHKPARLGTGFPAAVVSKRPPPPAGYRRRCFHHSSSGSASSASASAAADKQQRPQQSQIQSQIQPKPQSQSPRRISIADILAKRAQAGRLVAGTAAASDSEMFKVVTAAAALASGAKPAARRWDHHLSAESVSRQPCKLKQAARFLGRPGLISLGGGLPCPDNFPIESLTMRVPTVGGGFSEEETREGGETVSVGKYDASSVVVPPVPLSDDGGSATPAPAAPAVPTAEYDLSIALNYGQATGSPQMMRFVTEHTELVCNPPYADWASCLTVGSTAALEQSLRLLCDRSRGDSLLTEEFSFSTAIETAEPLGVRVFGVPVDEEGLRPDRMDELLKGWDAGKRDGARKPHVLYTVPSGQNPTGATQGEARRRAIYDVCREHDVFILEDEPYYFLQMPAYTGKATAPTETPPSQQEQGQKDSIDKFLDGLIPSLLSLDVDGRVLRMDSFSKVVVPGSRLGWVTASAQVVERYVRHAEVCNQGPSGVSQVVLHKLLDERWGHEGYLRWLMHLRGVYTRRRDVMLAACEEFLPGEVVSWKAPRAGMFHWLAVDHTRHPDASTRSILQIEEDIFGLCIDKGVLVAPGSWFIAEHGTEPTGLFFRATFAAATPNNMTEAIRRFGEAVRQSFGLL